MAEFTDTKGVALPNTAVKHTFNFSDMEKPVHDKTTGKTLHHRRFFPGVNKKNVGRPLSTFEKANGQTFHRENETEGDVAGVAVYRLS